MATAVKTYLNHKMIHNCYLKSQKGTNKKVITEDKKADNKKAKFNYYYN